MTAQVAAQLGWNDDVVNRQSEWHGWQANFYDFCACSFHFVDGSLNLSFHSWVNAFIHIFLNYTDFLALQACIKTVAIACWIPVDCSAVQLVWACKDVEH